MKFIDLFSGIGGFRSGLEKNGHECLAFCEIDKYARQSYKAIYNTENEVEFHDITKISNNDFRSFRGEIDIIAGGFPCQAFSIAGKRRGFEDTRGTLFFDIARAIKEIQPSYTLLENVKGLFSHDKGRTFGTIIQALDELGYVVEWGLFNSKYWGVPQNRERVFILATRKDVFKQPKLINLLNKQTEVNTRLLDLIEDEVDEKYYLSSEKAEKLTAMIDEKYNVEERVVVDATINEPKLKKVMNTVTARYDAGVSNYKSTGGMVIEPTMAIKEATKKGYAIAKPGDSVNVAYPDSKTRRGRVGNQIANTLLTGEEQGVVIKPKIAIKGFKEIVEVRKYDVNKLELSELLRTSKKETCISNKEISDILNVPITKVEHWFRSDKSFAIPDRKIWHDLKNLLNITNTEHDEAVATFEKKESEFETTNRIYDTEYLSPTLNATSEPKIAIPIQKCNFYAKDNMVVSEKVFSEDPFEYDYEYIEPDFRQIGKYYLLVNQDGTQAEVLIELKEGVYETVRVISDLDEIIRLEHITPKDSMGRMGEQAIETYIANLCEQGDTINAYNRTVDKTGMSPTLTTRPEGFKTAVLPITGDLRIRKLTPLECWRLQGFTDEQFYKAKNDGVSNSQLYKQAGNSVTVNVIDAIARKLI